MRARIVVPTNLCPVSQAPNTQGPCFGLSCRASGRAAGQTLAPAAVPASLSFCSPAYRPGPLCSAPAKASQVKVGQGAHLHLRACPPRIVGPQRSS